MPRSTSALIVLLLASWGCARESSPHGSETDISISETSQPEPLLPDVPELPDLVDSDETGPEGPDEGDVEVAHTEVEDVVCPPDRVPLVVDDVVVDPCGCCAIGGEYCHGLLEGGSPNTITGECELVHDAVPPCTNGIDPRGCPTHSCSGSCIADE